MSNYFNTLPLRDQLHQLSQCRFMDAEEFLDGISALKREGYCHCWLRCSGTKPRAQHA